MQKLNRKPKKFQSLAFTWCYDEYIEGRSGCCGECVSFGGKHIKRKSEILRLAWVQVSEQTTKYEI